ncbi:hypothetical protein ACFX13_029848 [Malus domestica]
MASSRLERRTLSFSLLSCLFLVVVFTPPSSSTDRTPPSDSSKVSLALYYESLCPYSPNFIVNYLVKLFKDEFISIVDLKVSLWGKAKLRSNDTFTCQNDLFLSLIAPRVWFTSTSRPSGSRVTRNWAWIQNLLLNATAVDMHGKEDYENFLSYVCNACNGTTALKACSRFSLSTIQNESSKSTRSVGYNEGNMAAVRGRIGSTITSWIRQMNLAILIWTFMV